MCIRPLQLQDKDTGKRAIVPCYTCIECRISRKKEWSLRLQHEARLWKDTAWICLTYSDKNLPNPPSVSKPELQKYFKRLRKALNHEFKYMACGEYGDEKNRPHYHIMGFGLSAKDENAIIKSWYYHDRITIDYNPCIEQFNYISGYVVKKLHGAMTRYYDIMKIEPEFLLMSRSKTLGWGFAEKYMDSWLQNGCIHHNGLTYKIPQAYIRRYEIEREDLTLLNYYVRDKLAYLNDEVAIKYKNGTEEVIANRQRETNIISKMNTTLSRR